ncbi:phospholipid-transporting ATPase VD-like isoform X3 [Clavelina lepadiformis]|uniref:phospholipid-transporting ATPase VD-like isoform X3 n=1 Tax=Clavelina lepadiformis TaxID=159417 RepID=UPI004042B208
MAEAPSTNGNNPDYLSTPTNEANVNRTSSVLTATRSIQNFLQFKKRRIRSEGKVRTLVNQRLFYDNECQICDETDRQLQQIRKLHKTYAKNKIQTTKYTVLSFLPKNLFEQFHRFANCYFVLIILLNFIPEIGAIQPFLSMTPVIAILLVQAIKDLFEDYGRYKSDREVNFSEAEVYRSFDDKYHKLKWADIQVGDIVRVVCNSVIPADLLLLHSSDADGICFIETSNIDGESNLKQRMVVKRHWEHSNPNEFHPRDFKSIVECQTPNNEIYKFHGNIIPPNNSDKIPVNNANLLLRGCVIRNTDYVEGIVVYAGHETKAMLNNNGPRYKRSKLERRMNTDVIYCVVLLIIMCLIGAIGNGVWADIQDNIPQTQLFIPPEENGNALNPALSGFYMFWTMVILLQVLIPISLYVSVELVKWAQVYMINNDLDLYHEETDTPMRCRALNIPEDLGQIQFVFSDKTGTLTENQMVFRRCTVGGVDYPHAANAARIENVEPTPDFIHPDHTKHHPENDLSRGDKSRLSYRRPHSGSIRPHHRRNLSTVSKGLEDGVDGADGAILSRSVPNSPSMNRKNMSTKRPAAHHRRNISSVSAKEVLNSIAHGSSEIIAQEAQEQNELYDQLPDEDLETDVTPDPVLFEQLTSIPNMAKYGSGDTGYKLSVKKGRIMDFFINLAICNTVVISNDSEPSEPPPTKKTDDFSNAANSLIPNVLKKVFPQKAANNSERYKMSGDRQNHLEQQTVSGKVHFQEVNSNNSASASPDGHAGLTNEDLSNIRYEAESPDEAALVYAAHAYGCILSHRSSSGGMETVTITLPNQEGTLTFDVLCKLPFDSTRKRMSVIVRDPRTNQVTLYCKGADSAILSLLSSNQPNVGFNVEENDDDISNKTSNCFEVTDATRKFLVAYAKTGLRTLCIAKRSLSENEYMEWLTQHKEAEQALDGRDELLMNSFYRIEQDLELLGATGIEDRLQDGVPETIESLRQAGIQVWVVTGDKQETAINIGYSCRLIHQKDEVITLNSESKEALSELLDIHIKAQEEKRNIPPDEDQRNSILNFNISFILPNSTTYPFIDDKDNDALVLVIDGKTLGFALQKDLQKKFVKLARLCRSVLCCRATPLQKGEVVKLIRDELNVMTLAIGDGANDVSMIQVADVGIGLSGQEGMQAVMSSDYALAQFRFLRKLLLVHGHWNYARLASMVLYFFYKNAAFVFLIFWFQFFCGYSGGNMIEQFYLLLFNLIFTSVPPLINGVLDKDVSQETLLKKPYLYSQGIKDELYLARTFWINILDAIYQSLVIFFFIYWTYLDTDVGLIEWGTVITTSAMFVILIHLGIETKTWTWVHWVAQIGSFVVYFGFALIYNISCVACSPPSNPYYVMETVIQTGEFWFSIMLTTVVALFPRYLVRAVQSEYFASESQMERIIEMRRVTDPISTASTSVANSSASSSSSSSSTYQNPAYHEVREKSPGDGFPQKRPRTLAKNGEKLPPKSEMGREALSYYGGSTPDLSSMSPYYGVHRTSANVNNNSNQAGEAHPFDPVNLQRPEIVRESPVDVQPVLPALPTYESTAKYGQHNVAYCGLSDESDVESETGKSVLVSVTNVQTPRTPSPGSAREVHPQVPVFAVQNQRPTSPWLTKVKNDVTIRSSDNSNDIIPDISV